MAELTLRVGIDSGAVESFMSYVADAVSSNEISPVAGAKLEELLKGITVVPAQTRKHSHYFKDVSHLKDIDVYRVIKLFNVSDPCVQHAVKKLLVAGGRGAGKDIERDLREAVDSINRALQMIAEDDVPRRVDPPNDDLPMFLRKQAE